MFTIFYNFSNISFKFNNFLHFFPTFLMFLIFLKFFIIVQIFYFFNYKQSLDEVIVIQNIDGILIQTAEMTKMK